MIKYVPEMTSVVLEEIPDRVTLAVDISNCRGNCVDCHSPFLKEDIGEELTPEIISQLVSDNFGIDCFLFLGEGRDPERLLELAAHVRALGLAPALGAVMVTSVLSMGGLGDFTVTNVSTVVTSSCPSYACAQHLYTPGSGKTMSSYSG